MPLPNGRLLSEIDGCNIQYDHRTLIVPEFLPETPEYLRIKLSAPPAGNAITPFVNVFDCRPRTIQALSGNTWLLENAPALASVLNYPARVQLYIRHNKGNKTIYVVLHESNASPGACFASLVVQHGAFEIYRNHSRWNPDFLGKSDDREQLLTFITDLTHPVVVQTITQFAGDLIETYIVFEKETRYLTSSDFERVRHRYRPTP